MTDLTEAPKRETVPRYNEAEIQRALVEVAACSGNTHMAARNLEADDDAPSIPQPTLWRWTVREKVQEYERIRAEALPQITAQAAEQHMALARQQMSLAQSAAGFIAARLDRMDDKDLINALGKADIGSGIHTEKAQLLAGQPTQIISRSSEEILREMASMGMKVQAIDAEVVGEEDVEESGPSSAAVHALSSD